MDGYTEERKQEILRSYQERSSPRGVQAHLRCVASHGYSWLKKLERLDLKDTLFLPKAP